MSWPKNQLLVVLLATCAVVAAMSLANHAGWTHFTPATLALPRWMAIALLAVYATTRRSLTLWILVGFAAGAELGYDAPALAVQFQILGTIFLRLIKVIIAPLLFGTLVVGIAGHAELKKIGRMAVDVIGNCLATVVVARWEGDFPAASDRAG